MCIYVWYLELVLAFHNNKSLEMYLGFVQLGRQKKQYEDVTLGLGMSILIYIFIF